MSREERLSVSCAAGGRSGPEKRVVVTGMGVVSCLGHDPDEFYSNLLEACKCCGHNVVQLVMVWMFSASVLLPIAQVTTRACRERVGFRKSRIFSAWTSPRALLGK